MKKTFLAIAMAAALTPFTFAAQNKPAPANQSKTTAKKHTTKKHGKKSASSSSTAAKPNK
ncbi:MAG TPA: hypothetical protein VFA33_21670 [Bryobacteraceae bacterium]|nr:hypothetical protein [Bryobacteraceae bacterium]